MYTSRFKTWSAYYRSHLINGENFGCAEMKCGKIKIKNGYKRTRIETK